MKIILIGGGKLTYFLAKQFASRGYYTTLINPNREEATALSRQLKATVICGEGSSLEVLGEAGAYQSDVVLALTTQDQDNLIACQIAQKEYGVPRTIALVNDPDNQAIFEQLGVTVAFSATQIIANLIEQQASSEEIKTFLPVADGKINVTEIVLQADSLAAGKTLDELQLPEDSLIACILRQDQTLVPSGDNRLREQDRLILISKPESYGQLLRLLVGT